MLGLFLCLVVVPAASALTTLTPDNAQQTLTMPLEQFISSSEPLQSEFFLAFYSPENEMALDLLDLVSGAGDEYERIVVQGLKQQGLTEFEQIEKALSKGIRVVGVDCEQMKQLCSFFNVQRVPTVLYLQKSRKLLHYIGDYEIQTIIQVLLRLNKKNVPMGVFQQHHLNKISVLSQIKAFMTNEKVVFILAFGVVPFLFGYLARRKTGVPEQSDIATKDSQEEKQKKN